MSEGRRVVAIAIDGGSPELIRRWVADGTMPNVARLIDKGASGTTRGLEHFFVGSTWPSFYTGTSPATHGHHSLVQLRPGSYESYMMADAGLVRGTPFWDVLSGAGRRVAILDVPLSKLSPHLNGIQTVEWGAHDAVYGFQCSTRALKKEIGATFGGHPLGPSCDGANRRAEDYDAFVARLLAGVDSKGRLTRALYAKERWDFLIQVFTESHCAGHQCWHLHDTDHPAYDDNVVALTGDPLKRVYGAIDSAIGEIGEDLDDDVTLVVFSAHGMSYWYGAQLLLPQILFKLGVTLSKPSAPPGGARARITDLAARAWRRLPSGIRRGLEPLRHELMDAGQGSPTAVPPVVDAPRSRCFPVNNGLIEGGIRLNLAGREPNGVVNAGADADRFCAELRRELLALTDERTGERLIRDVVRTSDILQGPQLHALPDLLVLWSDAVPTGSSGVGDGRGATIRAHSPRVGVVAGTNRYGRTGEHRPDGFCVFAGPGIERGPLPESFSLLDYAPTFTAMLGLEIPDAQGRVIDEVVRPA